MVINKKFTIISQDELFAINGGTFIGIAKANEFHKNINKEARKIDANGKKHGVDGEVIKKAARDANNTVNNGLKKLAESRSKESKK